MYKVALTGGIGSGKSTVAEMFARINIPIIDTDLIAHKLTQTNGAAIPLLRAQFGASMISDAGALDRQKMRDKVFQDAQAKKMLEHILHPMIRNAVDEKIYNLSKNNSNTHCYCLLVIPLLFGSGFFRNVIDRVLVVDCSEDIRINRVMKRSQFSEQQVRAIIATQAKSAQLLSIADDFLMNDGDAKNLLARITLLDSRYRRIYSSLNCIAI